MRQQCASVATVERLVSFEGRQFERLEAAGDLALVASMFDAVDRVTDPWLRVELDVLATVAAGRWAPAALEAFEAQLVRGRRQ